MANMTHNNGCNYYCHDTVHGWVILAHPETTQEEFLALTHAWRLKLLSYREAVEADRAILVSKVGYTFRGNEQKVYVSVPKDVPDTQVPWLLIVDAVAAKQPVIHTDTLGVDAPQTNQSWWRLWGKGK